MTHQKSNRTEPAAVAERMQSGEVAARGYSGLAARIRGQVMTAAALHTHDSDSSIIVLKDVREIEPSLYIAQIHGIIVENGSPFDHIGIWAHENGSPNLFCAQGAAESSRQVCLPEWTRLPCSLRSARS